MKKLVKLFEVALWVLFVFNVLTLLGIMGWLVFDWIRGTP